MCQLFIGAESDMWSSHAKSLRIDGVVTSIRMENFFWSVLDEIAYRDHMKVPQLITKLYHEAIDAEHDLGNFTSFLRVCCARYLALIAAGDVSASLDDDLGSVAAQDILIKEKSRRQATQLKLSERPSHKKLN
jgi:predicted DNA-binding ribbon-helix-helix protein